METIGVPFFQVEQAGPGHALITVSYSKNRANYRQITMPEEDLGQVAAVINAYIHWSPAPK